MLVRAQHIKHIVRNHLEVRRSEPFNRTYKAIIRLSLLLGAAPVVSVLFLCILHIPVLPVFGLFVMLWVLVRMSNSIADVAFRWCWPLHSRFLLYRNPERTDVCNKRSVKTRTLSSWLEFDEALGHLKVGLEPHWDLLDPYTLHLERYQKDKDTPTQLRLRLFQQGREPLVLGVRLSQQQEQAWHEELSMLNQCEGDVFLMDQGAFRESITALRHIHDSASEQVWPTFLDRFVRRRANPHAYTLRERRAPQRKLSDHHRKLARTGAEEPQHEVSSAKP